MVCEALGESRDRDVNYSLGRTVTFALPRIGVRVGCTRKLEENIGVISISPSVLHGAPFVCVATSWSCPAEDGSLSVAAHPMSIRTRIGAGNP